MTALAKASAPWLLLAAPLAVPLLEPSRYWLSQFVLFFIWATVVSQWNLVFGVAGVFSLAQLAIFAVGGYAAGTMALYLDWSLWWAMPTAGVVALLFSLLVGLACLRLRGAYVALLTLAIAQVLYLLIVTDVDCFRMEGVTCVNFTGGPRGLNRFGDFGFREWLGYKDALLGDYYLALGVFAAAFAMAAWLMHSPIGLAFRALKDNPGYAAGRGISRFHFQLIVFAASAFFTGVAGAVYAGHIKVVGPNLLSLGLLLFVLSMMVVGGVGRLWGPILGAAAMMLADEFLKDYVDWRMAGLGLIILLFVLLMPDGIAGTLTKLRQLTRRSAEGKFL